MLRKIYNHIFNIKNIKLIILFLKKVEGSYTGAWALNNKIYRKYTKYCLISFILLSSYIDHISSFHIYF